MGCRVCHGQGALVFVIDTADADDAVLVCWIIEGAVQRAVISDSRHHDDAVRCDLLDLKHEPRTDQRSMTKTQLTALVLAVILIQGSAESWSITASDGTKT